MTGTALPARRRLGALLSAYFIVIVGVITLAPFQFRFPDHYVIHWALTEEGWQSDLLLNVVLFLPMGFILRRAMRRTSDRLAILVLLSGAYLSACIEITQLFIPSRYTALSDVLSNSAGAWLGAFLSDILDARVGESRALVGKLRLDVPLMGVVYLLLPLLWLTGLTAHHGAQVLGPLLPLAIAGALALSAVSDQSAFACAASALAWFLVGAVPLLRTAPSAILVGSPVVVLAGWGGWHLWRRAVQRNRRLEPQVVRLLVPLVALHLVLLGFDTQGLALHGDVEDARIQILLWLGRAAAYTALGYLLAEARGRLHEPWQQAIAIPLAGLLAMAWLLGALGRGPAGAWTLVVSGVAVTLGAILYRSQRAYVIALLNVPPVSVDGS